MLKTLHKFKAQSVSEYAMTLSLVVLVIMGMTYFIQRLFSARINDARTAMLTALDDEIKNIHLLRGGTPYCGVLTEYEPYYVDKVSDVVSNAQTNVFINGPAGTYNFTSSNPTLINSVSSELPAQDQDL
ncbi:MAG: hypothetical protein NT079_04120 [Candidatus Omnitrophica bacterium]|nr:hypothetical protein [Candidatus Omnitrophota bacterium]